MLDRIIAKSAYEILHKAGRGTDFPGRLGTKLNRNFLAGFEMPPITIFVTGTAGKTTVAGILKSALTNCGYKVGTNSKGSNLLAGSATAVLANSSLSGKSKVDILVLEIDERYVKTVIPFINPDYFIITNLSRDQLARNGHFDIVFDDINDYLGDKTHLILNADNVMSAKFAVGKTNPVSYFGVSKNKYSGLDYADKIDVSYCPKCGSKLKYDYFNYGNFGKYSCPKCDFKNNNSDYEAEYKDDSVIIEGNKIIVPSNAVYNVYNIAAVYAQMRLLGIDGEKAAKALNAIDIEVKRFEQLTLGEKKATVLLSKNETPMSYNQSLDAISRIDEEKTLAIGFTRISGRYDFRDISWLYDINFERLSKTKIKKIFLFGKYAYDLSERLMLAGVDMSKVITVPDYTKVYQVLKENGEDVYCLFYFDMEKLIKKQAKEAGEKVW